MATDFKISDDGDLVIGADGDLELVTGDEQIIQEIKFRLKTTKGDWTLSPHVGCSLEEFIGKPNIPLIHTAIEERIKESLSYDNLITFPEVHCVDMPSENGDNTEVYILIEFSSTESEARKVQVTATLDLNSGRIMARSAVRDIV